MNSRKNGKKQLMQLVTTALLLALIVLFGLTPLGFINVGVVYITFLCIPVIIGTLAMGPKWGLVLGVGMGAVSFYTGMRAPSALVSPVLQSSVFWVLILCFLPRLLVPLAANAVYSLIRKRNEKIGYAVAAAAGSLTNTILYLGLLLNFYLLIGLDSTGLLGTVATIALTAGLPEAAAAAILTAPILTALKKAGLLARL